MREPARDPPKLPVAVAPSRLHPHPICRTEAGKRTSCHDDDYGCERLRLPTPRRGPHTDPQQSSSSSSSSSSSTSLCRPRRAGAAVGAGEALGLTTASGGAGLGTAVGRAGGAAGLGTRGAATLGRPSGTASVLVLVADEELGGSLGLATVNETVTAGPGGGSDRGSPLMAMTAIPTITPKEVAATPAATSRNMTIYRLAFGHTHPSMRRPWDRQFPMAQTEPRRDKRALVARLKRSRARA
jgi:hypothetical protein